MNATSPAISGGAFANSTASQAVGEQAAALLHSAGTNATAPLVPPVPIPGASSAPLSSPLDYWGGYFEALAVMFFVLGALWLLLWVMKKRNNAGLGLGGKCACMQIESRMALGPKKWIVVTRYLDKRLVLGVTEQQITLLTEIPLDEEELVTEQSSPKNATFASLFTKNKENPIE